MTRREDELVLLTTADSTADAALVRTHLEGAGIAAVLHGENMAAMLPQLGAALGVRVLVREADLPHAQALLSSATPVTERPEGVPLEDHVCPVHERRAVASCDRCGTFLCGQCGTLGTPAVCEDCLATETAALRPRQQRQRAITKIVAAVLLAPVLIALGLEAIHVLATLLGVAR